MESEIQANILLVDDRPENLLAMETVLSDLGQNLVRAGSAKEALRYLLSEDVALILLDVQMPGVDGFELAELIRDRERTQHTPIIFVTAISDNEQYIFKGYSLGAVDFLTKPIDSEVLRSKVRFFIKLFRQNEEIKKQALLLEESNALLDGLNVDLERRVAERTAELETANRELGKEVLVRKHSEARLALEHGITRVLADAADLENAAPAILRTFCDFLEADVSLLWLLNEEKTEISCTHVETSDSSKKAEAFVVESNNLYFLRGVDLPGQVWEQNEPVWLTNKYEGARYPRANFAKAMGLSSAVGFPIKVSGKCLGVIEFFSSADLPAEARIFDMLEAIGSEIGQFVRRKTVESEREDLLIREKALRAQAENISRLKDEFLATVSHELRTPLNSILGWGKILQMGKLSPEEQKTALDTIHRNALSQAQLIEDLLDTSRLITGNLRLDLSPTDVIPLISTAIDVIRPAVDAKGISVATEFNDTNLSITCDSHRLQQMVSNLLTNAVKFTPNNGSITVKCEHVDSVVQIIVTDTGQGIDLDFLPFIFDRFRQADSSSTRTKEGVGLGLAIVRHLAELHGGKVSAVSEGLGKGSRFTIELPAAVVRGQKPKIVETSGAAV